MLGDKPLTTTLYLYSKDQNVNYIRGFSALFQLLYKKRGTQSSLHRVPRPAFSAPLQFPHRLSPGNDSSGGRLNWLRCVYQKVSVLDMVWREFRGNIFKDLTYRND